MGIESESLRPIEVATRERLTDEQLGNLISAGGNHAAKAITLILMADSNIYSEDDLHRTLLFHQDQQIGWRMRKEVPFSYCARSLAPIGLVTKEVIDPDLSTYGYQITDYGKRIGIPFYGLMLDWSEKHRINLTEFWGATHSRSPITQIQQVSTGEEAEFKKRAPITTLKILRQLVTAPDLPIREIDLQHCGRKIKTGSCPPQRRIYHRGYLALSGLFKWLTRTFNQVVFKKTWQPGFVSTYQ